jgi:putative DNA primase/helicase
VVYEVTSQAAERIDRNTPELLKSLPQWVVWKYQHIPGRDKPKKPPFQTSGKAAAVDDPRTWCSYQQARALLETSDNYEGLGFMLDGGIVVIDLDYCLTEIDGVRRITKTAREVFDIARSYTEISPSGKGLHIFLRGHLPEENGHPVPGMKSDKGEMYTAKRYITITGEHVGEQHEIRADQDAINRIYALLKPPRQAPLPEPETVRRRYQPITRDDQALLRKAGAARNGAKFTRLYSGDITGYRSRSEAQLALIAMLVYWTNGDKGQVERLFKDSDMYKQDEELQKKWDTVHYSSGATYGQNTIETALKTSRQL